MINILTKKLDHVPSFLLFKNCVFIYSFLVIYRMDHKVVSFRMDCMVELVVFDKGHILLFSYKDKVLSF